MNRVWQRITEVVGIKGKPLVEAALAVFAYIVTYFMVKTLFLSFIPPLFLLKEPPTIQQISDLYNVNRIILAGISAFALVTIASRRLNLMPYDFSRAAAFECGRGALLATALVVGFLLARTHQFFGIVLDAENGVSTVSVLLIRSLSLALLILCEERLFRGYVYPKLLEWASPLPSAVITAILSVFVKWIQFPIGIAQGLTLFLLSILIHPIPVRERRNAYGASFLVGVLIMLHPILSLPIFGTELPGLFLVKYLSFDEQSWVRVLTGGSGGPLSGVLFQSLIVLEFARRWFQNRESSHSSQKRS